MEFSSVLLGLYNGGVVEIEQSLHMFIVEVKYTKFVLRNTWELQ